MSILRPAVHVLDARLFARQSFQQGIFFTGAPPTAIQAGVKNKLAWYGGNGKPVKISLMLGSGSSAQTVVNIASELDSPLADASYSWTPPTSLPNGNEYWLQIYQDAQNSLQSNTLILSGGAPPSASIPASLTATKVPDTPSTGTILASSSSSAASAALTAIATSTVLPSSDDDTDNESSPSGSVTAIAIALAVVLFLSASAAIFFFFFYRRRRLRRDRFTRHDNGSTTSTDDLMTKLPELPNHTEILEVRSDRDLIELGTPRSLGFLPAGLSRQELPSPMYVHETFTQESLCELQGSVVGEDDEREEEKDVKGDLIGHGKEIRVSAAEHDRVKDELGRRLA